MKVRLDRRAVLQLAPSAALAGCAPSRAGTDSVSDERLIVDLDREPDEVFDLWPQGPPGGEDVSITEHVVERDNPYGLLDRAAYDVTRPMLSLFRSARSDGSAMLIIPGGGYGWVVIDKEGFEGARYFSRRGVTVYVLKYRLPHQGWRAGRDAPLQDAQRAMRLIRARAKSDAVDPARLTLVGFSAGGHLAGWLTMLFDAKVYDAVDSLDAFSARPDATALVYPVITMREPFYHRGSRMRLIGAAPSASLIENYSVESMLRAGSPPLFLLHASDDPSVPVENSIIAYRAAKEAGAPVSLHIF
ncbi:MAG: alpha/beta hydrolase, partial [Parvularculaceae bacterium]